MKKKSIIIALVILFISCNVQNETAIFIGEENTVWKLKILDCNVDEVLQDNSQSVYYKFQKNNDCFVYGICNESYRNIVEGDTTFFLSRYWDVEDDRSIPIYFPKTEMTGEEMSLMFRMTIDDINEKEIVLNDEDLIKIKLIKE